jgi:enoyl-CoA hydratase/carnithine racemase
LNRPTVDEMTVSDQHSPAPQLVRRRGLLQAAAGLTLAVSPLGIVAANDESRRSEAEPKELKMTDLPAPPTTKVTVQRQGQIVLIGLNRPHIHNRVDPESYSALGKAFYQYEHDPSLRAAVLFGHGDNFSRGIDVDAYQALAASGRSFTMDAKTIDPLATRGTRLSKPLVVVVHGDTWNMGHELHLVADIRIASADTRFGQDENSRGRFPGGGATVRFVREAGWANAMRYMLTGEHWSADEAFRMGVVQLIVHTPAEALRAGIETAEKIASCGPLGIEATLASAHLAIDSSEADAFSRLESQYRSLYATEDFKEGRRAEAEGRAPIFLGK